MFKNLPPRFKRQPDSPRPEFAPFALRAVLAPMVTGFCVMAPSPFSITTIEVTLFGDHAGGGADVHVRRPPSKTAKYSDLAL